jgi:Tfp pilus assembly protein PilZ
MKERTRKKLNNVQNIILRDKRIGYTATIVDISSSGMSVKTDHVFPTYKEIDILMKIDEKPIQLKGSVRWVKEPLPNQKDKLIEVGIAIINPPEEFLQYFLLI